MLVVRRLVGSRMHRIGQVGAEGEDEGESKIGIVGANTVSEAGVVALRLGRVTQGHAVCVL